MWVVAMQETAQAASWNEDFPDHTTFLRMRDRDHGHYLRLANGMLNWPERILIAWMEATAHAGTLDCPIYRYYLTRNRNLLAVRDNGETKRLFPIKTEETFDASVPARDNPFSGIH